MAPAEGHIWETRLALEWRVGFRQLRTCRRTRPGQLCADIVAIAELVFRIATNDHVTGGFGAAFEAPADKVRFGRAASDGPAGCGAWPPARWRGWPGVSVACRSRRAVRLRLWLAPDRSARVVPGEDGRSQAEGDFGRAPAGCGLAAGDFTLRGLVAELAERGLKVGFARCGSLSTPRS
jgi:hypothetical protein